MADDRDPDRRQERLGQGAGDDPRRGLAGAGALQNVARVVEAVLLHAGQVGVTGSRCGLLLAGRARSGRHLLFPLGPLGVQYLDGDRGAERAPVAHAPDESQFVALEAHPGSAPVAESASGQFVGDLVDADRQSRRQPLDDDARAKDRDSLRP